MNIEISVIIPTYNRAGFISSTLDSILAQTLPAAELILVDDGSTDGTRELVTSQYGGRVKYLAIPNSGVCRARNEGVRSSRGSWIAFCDSDDLWRPERLQTQMKLLSGNPEVEYVFTDFCYVHGSDWSTRSKFAESNEWKAKLDACRVGDGFSVVREPLYVDFINFAPIFPSAVLMSRRRFDAIGGFDERWTRTSIEDMDFTLRCLQTPPFGVVDQVLVGIRRHDSNASGNRVRDLVAFVDILKYSKVHHELGPPNAAAIDRHILKGSIEAAELAFAEGKLGVVKTLLDAIPASSLNRKMRIKRALSMQPALLRDPVAKLLLKTAAGLRSIQQKNKAD